MKFPTNKTSDVFKVFIHHLQKKYDKTEAKAIGYLVFEHFLSLSKIKLLQSGDSYLNESEILTINDCLKTLLSGIPVQHITGKTSFYHCSLMVNSSVLIPRPETEELVDKILKENDIADLTFLDIGCGSACISIALKKNRSRWHAFALDISAEALDVAQNNAELNQTHIHFIQKDILKEPMDEFTNKFDFIVSNPPYIPLSEWDDVQLQVKNYEPHLALFVPNDSALIFYVTIAEKAKDMLKKNGLLYFELNHKYAMELKDKLENLNYSDIQIIQDLNGKHRFLKCRIN